MAESHLIPFSEDPQTAEANILATGRLLDTLRTEAAHPQTVIHQDLWFEDDGTFDSSVDPSLAEVPDPANNSNSYMAGLRPDGVGQVIMLTREGGVTGRVAITLYDGTPTRLLGERRVPPRTEFGLSHRENVDGLLADPDMLDQLGSLLPAAFDAKRAWLYSDSRGRLQAVGRMVRWIAGRSLFRKDSMHPPVIDK